MQLFEYIDVLNTPYEIYKETITTPDFQVKSHWHYYSEVLYLEKGAITVKCNSHSYTLTPGTLIFLPPQMLHRIVLASELPICYLVIKFDFNTLKLPRIYMSGLRLLFSSDEQEDAHIFTENDMAGLPIQMLTDICLDELNEKAFAHDCNVQACLSMLLVYLARILKERPGQDADAKKKEDNPFFLHLLEYIDDHSAENISVQMLAEKSGMSYSNFARLFKKQCGRSCKEYIEYIRISKAEEMVLYSDFDLTYIAQECGFSDSSAFIKQFRKYKGTTPRQYRVRMQGAGKA